MLFQKEKNRQKNGSSEVKIRLKNKKEKWIEKTHRKNRKNIFST